MTYGAFPTTSFSLGALITRVDPDNNYQPVSLGALAFSPFFIMDTSSVPSDFQHSEKQWTYNNCGYYRTSTGGEYIAHMIRANYASVSSLFSGTPNAVSLIPNYIKISTID